MEVRWEVEDGYVGKSRPQSFELNLEELIDGDYEIEDAMSQVHDEVQEEFVNRITWCFSNYDEVLAEVGLLLERRAAGNADV